MIYDILGGIYDDTTCLKSLKKLNVEKKTSEHAYCIIPPPPRGILRLWCTNSSKHTLQFDVIIFSKFRSFDVNLYVVSAPNFKRFVPRCTTSYIPCAFVRIFSTFISRAPTIQHTSHYQWAQCELKLTDLQYTKRNRTLLYT